jgi:hypothetical protein
LGFYQRGSHLDLPIFIRLKTSPTTAGIARAIGPRLICDPAALVQLSEDDHGDAQIPFLGSNVDR